ncbi:MAG: hypothetical protein LBQ67_04610 [Treponema sp.]|nr:hypothetical protein [Treponema sp.]
MAAAIFLLVGSVFLYGRGDRDEVLSWADSLMENKEYDEAIQILSEYMKTNPDKFKDAQRRLQRIIRIRERYNAIADELLDTLRDRPDDNERILELTEALNAIEPATNPTAQRFLRQVAALAVFNRNRSRLEAILANGRALLERGDYTGAMAAYAGGLDIYQEEYFSAGYGEEAERLAREGLENVFRELSNFSALEAPFNQAAGRLRDSVGGPYSEEIPQLYGDLARGIEDLTALRNKLREVAVAYNTQQKILQEENEDLGDRSFLAFAFRLIHRDEGMLGVLDRFWEDKVSPAEAAVADRADFFYGQAYAAADNREYSRALPLLENAAGYISISLDFINRRYAYKEKDDPPAAILFNERVLLEQTGDYLKYRAMGMAVSAIKDTEVLGQRVRGLSEEGFPALSLWREGLMGREDAEAAEQRLRNSFTDLGAELALVRTTLNDGNALIENSIENYRNIYEESGTEEETPLAFMNNAGGIIGAVDAFVREQIANSVLRRYTISNGDFEKELTAREGEFAEADALIQGIPQTPRDGIEYIAHYPSEGLIILTSLSRNLSANLAVGRELLSRYGSEDRETLNFSGMSSLYASAQAMFNRLDSLQARIGPLTAATEAQIFRADAFRNEGDLFFREAQAAADRDQLEIARERLDTAAARYQNSLALQESPSLRAAWDTQLVNLGTEIARRLNDVIIREVRTLVNNARDVYYEGNFDRAENFLVRAQNRWRITNSVENSEVAYWLNLVRGALSLYAGKTIPITAPLYAEMSQLLSEANRDFEEGLRMLNGGRRQAGLSRLSEVLQITREIRLIFPMNQEARLLELRTEQVTDPDAFERTFRDRINEAIAGTKPGLRSQESFATLQELALINPQYPNIDRIIRQARIDMGLIPPDPDPRAIARSSELTRLARSIIDAQNSVQYQIALAQLDEAILLNPTNNNAIIAKDILLTRTTGSGVIVLDSNSREEYDRAVLELQQGKYINAWTIVQRLLQNPRNRNSTLILDLQRRIESVL